MDSIWYTFFFFIIFRISEAVRILTSELQHRKEDRNNTENLDICHTGQHCSNLINLSH